MLIYTTVALLTTMIIGYLYETVKEHATMKAVKNINQEIGKLISEYRMKDELLDVFEVNGLRQLFKERLMDRHIVDDFKLYKKDNRHVSMTFRKAVVIQSLELTIDRYSRDVAIGEVEIIENPFEEIHL